MNEAANGTQRLDVRQVEAALKRAAAKARLLGNQTGTPVFVLRDGKIVDLTAEAAKPKSRES
jgi:protein-disulfide isomerase